MNQPWVNAVAYQAVWFATVIGANHDQAWPGVLTALLFLALTCWRSPHRALDLRLIAASVMCGLVIDSTCAWLGLLRYAAPMAAPWSWLAPCWILTLWAAFSTTLTRSMKWLMPRPWLGMLLGGVGAPLAYRGAAAMGDSVRIVPPEGQALVALGVGWAMAMALLLHLARPTPSLTERRTA